MTISHLAEISPLATIGKDVAIGPFTVVHDNVIIGDGSVVQSHCAIGIPTPFSHGRPLIFGANSVIRSHSIFYEGSTFGPHLQTGHQVSVRENLSAGSNLQLGTLADVQGNATIGDFVRIYDGAHIAQHTTVGNFAWIFPYVIFTNDPHPPSDGFLTGVTVEDFAVIATRSTILPGVTIGADSVVGAESLVSKDVRPGTFVSGNPAKTIALAKHIQLRDGTGSAYPWRRHFHRGMPDEAVKQWIAEFGGDITA